jgi:hypothetical protein
MFQSLKTGVRYYNALIKFGESEARRGHLSPLYLSWNLTISVEI